MTDSRSITLVSITNNPQSEPPLELIIVKPKGFKFVQGIALAGVFLAGVGGSGTYTAYAESGGLAASGMTLNTTTGEITGTPSASGAVAFAGTVTDSAANSFTTNFAFDVISELNFDSPPAGTAEELVAFSQSFPVAGATGTVTWSHSGSLPSGVTLNTSTGLLSGTPASSTAATYSLSITASDSGTGSSVTTAFVVTVYPHGVVTFDSAGPSPVQSGTFLPPIYVGVPWSTNVTVTGGVPPYTFTDNNGVITSLGLSVQPRTGQVSGTIYDTTLAAPGGYDSPYLLEVKAVDALGAICTVAQAGGVIMLPQNTLQAKAGGSNVGNPGPSSINLHSSDASVNITGTNSGGAIDYDLKAAGGSGSNTFTDALLMLYLR